MTADDGYRLGGRLWVPADSTPRGAVLYLHGIQSHGGWFEWSASLMAEAGLLVLLPDRRGSGMNSGQRGDVTGNQRWLRDLDTWADWAGHRFGVTRLALVGVSWGGKLAVAWSLHRPERAAQILLVAPGIYPQVDLSLCRKLLVALSLAVGGGQRFEIPLSDPALFTDNPSGRQFIRDDPLRLTHVTARFLWQSHRLDRWLHGLPAGAIGSPMMLVLAERDRIIRNEATEIWARRVASQPVEVRRISGTAHTLEFSADPEPYALALGEWVARVRAGENPSAHATGGCRM